MEYKKFILFLIVVLTSGCAGNSSRQSEQSQSYRKDVREHMNKALEELEKGQLPRYHWQNPLVQKVNVPGHVSNGIFVPAHEELVIIKPGEWVEVPARPIESQEESYAHTNVHRDMGMADITHLPGESPTSDVESAGKEKDPKARVGTAQ